MRHSINMTMRLCIERSTVQVHSTIRYIMSYSQQTLTLCMQTAKASRLRLLITSHPCPTIPPNAASVTTASTE